MQHPQNQVHLSFISRVNNSLTVALFVRPPETQTLGAGLNTNAAVYLIVSKGILPSPGINHFSGNRTRFTTSRIFVSVSFGFMVVTPDAVVSFCSIRDFNHCAWWSALLTLKAVAVRNGYERLKATTSNWNVLTIVIHGFCYGRGHFVATAWANRSF